MGGISNPRSACILLNHCTAWALQRRAAEREGGRGAGGGGGGEADEEAGVGLTKGGGREQRIVCGKGRKKKREGKGRMNRGEDWDRFWDAETVFKNWSQSNKRKRERACQIAGEGASFDEASVNDECENGYSGPRYLFIKLSNNQERWNYVRSISISCDIPSFSSATFIYLITFDTGFCSLQIQCVARPIGCCCGRDEDAASEPK